MTPPVTPKIAAAPVDSATSSSKHSSSESFVKSMRASLIMRASSRVVMEISTERMPSVSISGRSASNFLATHGMTATTTMFFGSMPAFSA